MGIPATPYVNPKVCCFVNASWPHINMPSFTSTMFLKACDEGSLDVVSKCIEAGIPVTSIDDGRNSGLHLSCYRGHAAIASFLLTKVIPFCSVSDFCRGFRLMAKMTTRTRPCIFAFLQTRFHATTCSQSHLWGPARILTFATNRATFMLSCIV